jgi:hypothetical protein
VIHGNYTFSDANTNGMSDAWEQEHFGAVLETRLPATDTDGDGVGDYAEFIAGTDPVNPRSSLWITPPIYHSNGTLRLSWASSPGHIYRILGSQDAQAWSALSDWLRANGSQMSFTLPPRPPPAPYLFRLEVRP